MKIVNGESSMDSLQTIVKITGLILELLRMGNAYKCLQFPLGTPLKNSSSSLAIYVWITVSTNEKWHNPGSLCSNNIL